MVKNNINIIAIINYNQKNYCIYQINDNIGYAVFCNKELKFNIDSNDIEMLNKFYNLIRYNHNYSVFCGSYRIKRNEFEIYQDTRSNLYTFVLKKNDKRYIPTEEDTILLNSYFNDENFVYYNQNQENTKNSNTKKQSKPLKFIKKILKVGGITVVALISAATLIYNLPQDVKSNLDYELGKTFRTDLTKKDKSYTFEDLKSAIDSNANISEEEKLFIKEVFEAEFEENKEYMDIATIIRRLKTLKIQYEKYYTYNEKTGEYELTHGNDMSRNAYASYDVLKNKITCFEHKYSESKIEEKKDEPFGFNEVSKSSYYHELNHLFTKVGLDSALSGCSEILRFLEFEDYIRTNSGIFENVSDDMQRNCNTSIFRETINEIFNQEYVDKYYQRIQHERRDRGYRDDLAYMYCLAEILSLDALKEYKFNDNDSIITEELLNISDNKTEAYKFMTSLKSLKLYNNLVWRAATNNNVDEFMESGISLIRAEKTEEVKQVKQEQTENYKRIHDGFAYFYKAKYNKDMSNDMNILIYLYNTSVLTDEEKKKVTNFLNLSETPLSIRFEAKGYFAKDYIEAHPYVTVTYLDDKDFSDVTMTIDKDNRYLESNTQRKQDIER